MNVELKFLFWIIILTTLVNNGVVSAQGQLKTKPNIIFIMADDLGIGDLGCYGQKMISTPRIDQMAKEGVQFTQVYAGSSVCAPSRSSLMTGMHNGHNRVRDNIPHEVFLLPDDLTVAEVLKQSGYTTGGIGKWGLGNPGSWGIPNYQGFDYYYGHLNQDQAHYYYPDYLWENDKISLLQGNRGEKKEEYTHNLFIGKAIDFIEANAEHPFFLYLPLTLPHFSDYNLKTPESHIVPSDQPYSDKKWPQVEKNYANMVDMIDKGVGRILDKIKELGLDNNTIIFFTSDNGPAKSTIHDIEFFNSNGIYKGGKRDMTEGGIRIPMIVRWPGMIKPGTFSDKVWAFWDFLPTAADLAQFPTTPEVDGISILPTLLGKKQKLHEYLYWDYGHVRGTFKQAVRWANWKGIRKGANSTIQLFNLEKDPEEEFDVALKNPEVVKKINEIMSEAYTPSKDFKIKD